MDLSRRFVGTISLPSLALLVLAAPSPCQDRAPAPFEAANIVIPTDFGRMDALVDLNWDGVMDAVGFYTSPSDPFKGALHTFISDGQGSFAKQDLVELDILLNDPKNELLIGDWNGDGHDDFALLGSSLLVSYVSNGSDQPSPYSVTPLIADPLTMACGDFDDDGHDDIAMVSLEGLRVFHSGLAASTMIPGQPAAGLMVAGEFTGDGVDDIGIDFLGRFRVITRESGSFAEGSETFHLSVPGTLVSVGDIDRDGDTDVTLFGPLSYIVLRRDGANSFTAEAQQVGGPAHQLVDVDGDGDLDGVCCGGGGGPPTSSWNRERNYFHIAINDSPTVGTNRFRPAILVPSFGARHLAGAADIDGDGFMDLVAGRSVLFGKAQLPGDMKPMSITNTWDIEDLDMDGDPDFDFGLTRVQRNAGDGVFSEQAPRMPEPPAGGLWGQPSYKGDFDGDGAVDLIVGHYQDNGTFAPPLVSLRLLRNCGGGHFVDGGPAGPDGTFFKVPQQFINGLETGPAYVVADVDGDGDLDLAVNTSGQVFAPDVSQLWINDGAGVFTAGARIDNWVVLAAANFDGDAYGDLILGSNPFYALSRGGPSGYEAIQTLAPRNRLSNALVTNVDGDAYPDLFILSSESSQPTLPMVLFGGPTAFSDVQRMPGVILQAPNGVRAYELLAGDVDGDGRTDLAINNLAFGSTGLGAWIALQDELGDFEFVRQYLDIRGLADLDGDGDLDAVGNLQVVNTIFEAGPDGSRQQYGVGSNGADGLVPVLGASGPFRAGETLGLRMSGGVGGAPGVYWFGGDRSTTDFFGLTINIWPLRSSRAVVLDGQAGEAGAGNAYRPHVIPASLAGTDLYVQAFFLDAAGPLGLSATNGLHLYIGQ